MKRTAKPSKAKVKVKVKDLKPKRGGSVTGGVSKKIVSKLV
jgi:hypothetical protein